MATLIMIQVVVVCLTAAIMWQIRRRQGPNGPLAIWRVIAAVILVVANTRATWLAIADPEHGLARPLFTVVTSAVAVVLLWTFGLRPSRPL